MYVCIFLFIHITLLKNHFECDWIVIPINYPN